ncbi:flagellin [Pectobacterium betavasculorum]
MLSQENIATAAACSRILDADYAVEVSAMTKNQILQQASLSVLSQANQQSGNVLKLLSGSR